MRLKIVTKAIARRSKNTAIHDFNKIPEMGNIALEMIRDALSVFAEFDEKKPKIYGLLT